MTLVEWLREFALGLGRGQAPPDDAETRLREAATPGLYP